jgi:hypothetical protein
VDVFGLFRRRFRRHCRQSVLPVMCHKVLRFHFPASLGSTVITRFLATTDALTPVGRLFGPLSAMNTVCPQRVSLFNSLTLPAILSPITDRWLRGFSLSFTGFFSTRSLLRWPLLLRQEPSMKRLGPRRGFRAEITVSSHRPAESSSLCLCLAAALLRTGRSPPAAPHPVSPQRSSLRSQAGDTSA